MTTADEVKKLFCQNSGAYFAALDNHIKTKTLESKRALIAASSQYMRYQLAIVTARGGIIGPILAGLNSREVIFPDKSFGYIFDEKESERHMIQYTEPKGQS